VQERAIAERPLQAGETAFQEGTMRIPVRGEEAVVAKEAVVTGEVVVAKGRVAEERTITDTVRKEHVEVDESAHQARTDRQQRPASQAAGQMPAPMAVEPAARRSAATSAASASAGDNWEELHKDVREAGERARD
jgi:hypothetical protein